MTKSKREKKSNQLPLTKCKGCPKTFYPKDNRQKFHNEICREEYYARTYYHKTSTQKKCPNCGNMFPTTMPVKQDYCNDSCREEYRKKRKEGIQEYINNQISQFYSARFKTLQSTGFKCSYCGKDVSDGVKLDVEPDGAKGYRTICSECVIGRDYSGS